MGVENLTNDTPPKKAFWTPPRTVGFPPPSGVSALFLLYKNPRQSRPEALLEGSKPMPPCERPLLGKFLILPIAPSPRKHYLMAGIHHSGVDVHDADGSQHVQKTYSPFGKSYLPISYHAGGSFSHTLAGVLRGNTIRANRARNSERRMAL